MACDTVIVFLLYSLHSIVNPYITRQPSRFTAVSKSKRLDMINVFCFTSPYTTYHHLFFWHRSSQATCITPQMKHTNKQKNERKTNKHKQTKPSVYYKNTSFIKLQKKYKSMSWLEIGLYNLATFLQTTMVCSRFFGSHNYQSCLHKHCREVEEDTMRSGWFFADAP